jgi:hypothetical protein
MTAANKMPLILDGSINTADAIPVMMEGVEVGVDLFGDPVLGPSKQLHRRIDELRSRGCCQYVSSTPTLARIPRSNTHKERSPGQNRAQ